MLGHYDVLRVIVLVPFSDKDNIFRLACTEISRKLRAQNHLLSIENEGFKATIFFTLCMFVQFCCELTVCGWPGVL